MESQRSEELKNKAILIFIGVAVAVTLVYLFHVTLDGITGIILGNSWDLVFSNV